MSVRQPSLETLARHNVLIARLFWASTFSGPVLFAITVALIRRGRHSRDLRWVVDQGGTHVS